MVEGVKASDISDPLPQAMVLTAIVIMLATTAFVLAMAYRSWRLNGHDDVQDDPEDALIRRLATHDIASEAYSAASDDNDEIEEASDFMEGELGDPDDPEETGDKIEDDKDLSGAGERPTDGEEQR
jgi:multicomponent Na+:H+ antiporter subunit C